MTSGQTGVQLPEMKAQLDATEIKEDIAVPYAAVRDINGKAHSSLNIDAISKSTSPSNVSSLLILIYRPKSNLVPWIHMSRSILFCFMSRYPRVSTTSSNERGN
jgi:hypothetical protein